MAETFSYRVKVNFDNSEQIKSIRKSLLDVKDAVKGIRTEMKDMGKGVTSALSELNKFRKTVEGITAVTIAFKGLKMVVSGVYSVLQSAGSGLKSFFTSVIDAAQFKQDALFLLDRKYKGQGKQVFEDIVDLAGLTPSDTEPLLKAALAMSNAFKDVPDLKKMLLLFADVQTTPFGKDPAYMEGFVKAFTRVAEAGKFDWSLDFLTNKRSMVNKILAQELKINEKNDTLLQKKLDKLEREGKITRQMKLDALVAATNADLGQGKVGQTALGSASGSLSGAVSNFQNVLKDSLLKLDFDQSAGIASFRNFLVDVTNIIKSDDFRRSISTLVEDVFGVFKSVNLQDIKSFFMTVRDIMKEIGTIFKGIFETMLGFFRGGASIKALFAQLIISLKDVFVYIGRLIGSAIWSAIKGGTENAAELRRFENRFAVEEKPKEKTFVTPSGVEIPIINMRNLAASSANLNLSALSNFNNGQPMQLTVNNNITPPPGTSVQDIAKETGRVTVEAIKQSNKKDLRKGGKSN